VARAPGENSLECGFDRGNLRKSADVVSSARGGWHSVYRYVALTLGVLLAAGVTRAQTSQVLATVETDPVSSNGDAADDPAIWVHPTDTLLSTIFGTDKQQGLAVYDASGQEIQFVPDGDLNNVDMRYGFPMCDGTVDLAAAGDRTAGTLAIYEIDRSTGMLSDLAARTITVGVNESHGLTLYRSPETGRLYLFTSNDHGLMEQWELFDDGTGRIDAARVRQFAVGSEAEGMVADDELGILYVSQEDVGIWRYGAEPDDGSARTQVDAVDDPAGHLVADVEGLAIYYASAGTGYLIASSQGDDKFAVYGRQPPNPFVMQFEIVPGDIDGVTHTDGIDVTNFPFGFDFPLGVFVAQDDKNPGGKQNFKLVPWQAIATSVDPPLLIDTTTRPAAAPVPDNCNCPPGDCSGLDGMCSAGACDPATSHCEALPTNEGGTCDDGDPCTVDETCQAGSCTGDGLPDTDGDGSCDLTDDDDDGDGFDDVDDCAPLDAQNWDPPGETTDLVLTHGGGTDGTTILTWTAPTAPGGTTVVYSTLASLEPDDFVDSITCIESGDGSDTSAADTQNPHSGTVRYYLVRAENGCGPGSLGEGSDGTPRAGGSCVLPSAE
jgi:3-phytase